MTTEQDAVNVVLFLRQHESTLHEYISDEDYKLLQETIKGDNVDSSQSYPPTWKSRNGKSIFKEKLRQVLDAASQRPDKTQEEKDHVVARQILRCIDANPPHKELVTDEILETLNGVVDKSHKSNGEEEYPEEWNDKDNFEPILVELLQWLDTITMDVDDPPGQAGETPLWNAKKFAVDENPWLEVFQNPKASSRSLLLVAEVYLQEDNSLSQESLYVRIAMFILNYPGSSERLKENLKRKRNALLDPYIQAEKTNPAPAPAPGDTVWKYTWLQNPNEARTAVIGTDLLTVDWNTISLSYDPHDETRGAVQGKILYLIRYYAVVWLPPLPGAMPGEERIALVKISDHDADVARFSSKLNELNLQKLKLDPQKPNSLKGRSKSHIKIINYACASVAPNDTKWPFAYMIGYDDTVETKELMAWARSMYNGKFRNSGDTDINLQRQRCGVMTIVPAPM